VIGHLGINVGDLGAAKAYYNRLMPLLDFEPYLAEDDQVAYRPARGKPGTYLFLYPAPTPEGYDRSHPGLQHLAFMVPTRGRVHEVHDLVRELGSEVVLAPQEFPQYPPPYYAVFWRDRDGFVVEAVCHHDRD